MSTEFWVLYNPNEKTKSERLTTEDTQFSLMKLKTKEINDFLIWKADWSKWRKLKEFLLSQDSPFMNTFFSDTANDNQSSNAKSSIKMSPVDKETEKKILASFSNVQLDASMPKNSDKAGLSQFDDEQITTSSPELNSNFNFKGLDKNNAFQKNSSSDKNKLELLLMHPKGSLFRTIVKDISLAGASCERIIPDEFHHTTFDVVVINNFIADPQYSRLTLKSKINSTDSNLYLEFVNATETETEKLRSILDYYIRSVKKMNA